MLVSTGSSTSGACTAPPGAATPGGALVCGASCCPTPTPPRSATTGENAGGDDVQHRNMLRAPSGAKVLRVSGDPRLDGRSHSGRGPWRRGAVTYRPTKRGQCELARDLPGAHPGRITEPGFSHRFNSSVLKQRALPSDPSHGAVRATKNFVSEVPITKKLVLLPVVRQVLPTRSEFGANDA